jgi:pyruvate ferredoxin oxidoreductase alpha subunit
MAARDQGWIQIYSENPQEVYENTILAVKLAEKINMPAMICQDGFVTTHSVENTTIYSDEKIKKFLNTRKSYRPLLDTKNPVTYGPLQLQDYYFETKKQLEDTSEIAKKEYKNIAKELKKITGKNYPYFEKYKIKDAKHIIVTMSSTAGTTKEVVDKLRKKGKKVGLLKIRLYRPMNYADLGKNLINAKNIAVLDRSMSIGAEAPIYTDVKSAILQQIYKNEKINPPKIQSYVFGLGGDIYEKQIENVFTDLINEKITKNKKYIGLR